MADDSPASVPDDQPLKLRAVDAQDLAVVSAFLQDSIANVSEMAYVPDQRMFALAVCRFRWERAVSPSPEKIFERVSCAVTIQDAGTPKYRGFELRDRHRTMPLLAITYDGDEVMLTFAGDAAVRLQVSKLDLRAEDFGECWPTKTKPEHGNIPL
jgi:hypothetical protein